MPDPASWGARRPGRACRTLWHAPRPCCRVCVCWRPCETQWSRTTQSLSAGAVRWRGCAGLTGLRAEHERRVPSVAVSRATLKTPAAHAGILQTMRHFPDIAGVLGQMLPDEVQLVVDLVGGARNMFVMARVARGAAQRISHLCQDMITLNRGEIANDGASCAQPLGRRSGRPSCARASMMPKRTLLIGRLA